MQLQISCNKYGFHPSCRNGRKNPRFVIRFPVKIASERRWLACRRRGRGPEEPARGLREHPDSPWRPLVAKAAGLCRPRLSGLGRLYGPGQLGDRPRRRVEVWLHPAVGHPDLEPDGDPAAGAGGAARHRHRSRSGAGLPRHLFAAGQLHALAGLRGGDHRLRSRRGHRHRDRAEIAVRHSPARRRADHGPRRFPAAAVDEQGLSLPRGFRHCASDRDRGLLCDPDHRRRAAGRRDAEGFCAVHRDLHQSRDALYRHRHHRRDGHAA